MEPRGIIFLEQIDLACVLFGFRDLISRAFAGDLQFGFHNLDKVTIQRVRALESLGSVLDSSTGLLFQKFGNILAQELGNPDLQDAEFPVFEKIAGRHTEWFVPEFISALHFQAAAYRDRQSLRHSTIN